MGSVDLRQARDLISQLLLPAQAGVLLEESKFWHSSVCRAVFGESDRIGFEDPQAGLEIAQYASRLVDRLPGEHRSDQEKTLLKGRSFVILGSRLRQLARLRESEVSYLIASGLSRSAPPLDIADMYMRLVYLRIDQRRFESARSLASHTIQIYREFGTEHLLGCALLSRGAVHFDQGDDSLALDDWSEAARKIDPAICSVSYYSALHNLGAALVKCAAQPEEIDRAVEQIQRAKQMGYGPDSLPDLNLQWLEGQLLAKVKREQEAETIYRNALKGFAELSAYYEFSLLSLDLAELLCKQRRFGELIEIAAAMFPLFARFRVNREVIAALRLFHHAAVEQRVDFDLIAQVRSIIANAARRMDG